MAAGSEPWVLCYNSHDDRVYCALNYSNVAVIDGAADSVITTLPTRLLPSALCYDSLNDKIYCSISGDISDYDSAVTVIDGASNEVLMTIAVGRGPCALVWNPAENRVYVANWDASSISVLRDSMSGIEESLELQSPSRKPAATVVRSLPPGAVAFDAMGRRVVDPRSGILFMRQASSTTRGAPQVTKVVIQH
jgi:YVTN family beta-propeller protein